jgi:hypothetical protein
MWLASELYTNLCEVIAYPALGSGKARRRDNDDHGGV